jgi:predicted nucleic acid-binding protein
VEIMFLVHTNIFLEILMRREKKEDCRKFLDNNIGNLNITDFSLHSIGVILFRHDKEDVFRKFVEDVVPNTKVLSLPIGQYRGVINAGRKLNLDFDDAYQYTAAKCYGLRLATMDKDFERIKDAEILFL